MKIFFKVTIAMLAAAGTLSLAGAEKFITYEEFGAKGDGRTDDMKAIAAAHAAANAKGLPVKAAAGKTYYVRDISVGAVVQTDTDFGTAKFIIDDTDCFDQRNQSAFTVAPTAKATDVADKLPSLKIGQKNIGFAPGVPAMISLSNDRKHHYIRAGGNRDKGKPMLDSIRVDKEGNVDPTVPLRWDFDHVSKAILQPIDEKTITVQGGHFVTIANQAPTKYTSYRRGIRITRANVIVRNIRHEITGEGDHGAPYSGFLQSADTCNVLFEDCFVSGHKTYASIGRAGHMVDNGTYDLSTYNTLDVTLRRCIQTDDIRDTKKWGIFASNDCKNITFDHCRLSRYDSHRGVHNLTILDCILGHQGVAATGTGTLRIERTTVYSKYFIRFRGDYGATWTGKVIIKDCTQVGRSAVFCVWRSWGHDFGHPCSMPGKIVIDGLTCKEDAIAKREKVPQPMVLFRCGYTAEDMKKPGPAYPLIRELELHRLKPLKGKTMPIADYPEVFKDLKITGDASTVTR